MAFGGGATTPGKVFGYLALYPPSIAFLKLIVISFFDLPRINLTTAAVMVRSEYGIVFVIFVFEACLLSFIARLRRK